MCVYLSEVCGVATRETHLVLLFLIRSAKDCGGFGPQYNDPIQRTSRQSTRFLSAKPYWNIEPQANTGKHAAIHSQWRGKALSTIKMKERGPGPRGFHVRDFYW